MVESLLYKIFFPIAIENVFHEYKIKLKKVPILILTFTPLNKLKKHKIHLDKNKK